VRGRLAAVVLAVAGGLGLAGCQETTDSLGYQGVPDGLTLHPLHGPASYPNVLRDLPGVSDADVTGAVMNGFNTLFHGDALHSIYFPVGTDQAKIEDSLHGGVVRTEGMGLGMLICVQLKKRDEFDRLWRYSKANLQITTGPNAGYFQSYCDGINGGNTPCIDPYGMEEYVMALIFAHDQWGTAPQDIDYGADALALLDVMRHKQDQNGGVDFGDGGSVGVTNVFDQTTALAFDTPDTNSAGQTRPAIPKPAYYDLWAQAIADPFWTRAAGSARAYWQRTADPTTGFLPTLARFNGRAVPPLHTYEPSAYRAQVNMALDWVWSGGTASAWEVDEANRLLTFLSGVGINNYGKIYTLGGQVIDPTRDMGAVAINGMTALVSSPSKVNPVPWVQAVWNNQMPMGDARYFVGLFELISLMVLGDMMHVI
jgi:oligosaccharide reducing-end xylanase